MSKTHIKYRISYDDNNGGIQTDTIYQCQNNSLDIQSWYDEHGNPLTLEYKTDSFIVAFADMLRELTRCTEKSCSWLRIKEMTFDELPDNMKTSIQ